MNSNLMKRRFYLLISFLLGGTIFVSAQSPVDTGLNTINRSSAESTRGFQAADELQGREAA